MCYPMPENDFRTSRRRFLHVTGALTLGTTCGRSLLAAGQSEEAPAATPQGSALSDADLRQQAPSIFAAARD
jgi:hypothetical protein